MASQLGLGLGGLPLEEAALAEGREVGGPTGGEGVSSGGMGVQILRVFLENKLAIAGAASCWAKGP